MIARSATPGLWIDMSQRPTPAQARAIVAALDPVGVVRTLPLPGNNPMSDLQSAELTMWIDLGLEVMAYQHVRASDGHGWDPRNHSGATDGSYAAQYAIAESYPIGAHIWVDWEDLIAGLPVPAGKLYLESWAERTRLGGVLAGMYCGFDDPLSPVDRYNLSGITSYWSDAGHRSVAVRGCSIVQGREITVAGVRVDLDHLAADLKGEAPMVCAADPQGVA